MPLVCSRVYHPGSRINALGSSDVHIDEGNKHTMTTRKRRRATVIVEWEAGERRGVLVHADRRRNEWLLPGGGRARYLDGSRELPMAAAVRELQEETGLIATSIEALFDYSSSATDHAVFRARVSGTLDAIVDPKEAPAFALCGSDLALVEFLCLPGYSTASLRLSRSVQVILQRYYSMVEAAAPVPPSATWIPAGAGSAQPVAPAVVAAPALPAPALAHSMTTAPDGSARVQIGRSVLELVVGDIVRQKVDAVVNAANEQLANGSGVCGAIHRAAGESDLQRACQSIGYCPTGEARITHGFRLAPYIIHAVGPIYSDYRRQPEQADRLLVGAYRFSLELAREHRLQRIAFPSIATGVYGFPVERAAPLALQTVIDDLRQYQAPELVRFVLWEENLKVYTRALEELAESNGNGAV
jgi:O-acetyl-ADP-ribose deacetylase (regulator of RNase III)/8-oxo-dGTP pyrophosphatase MutT (NUDIX family)